MRVGIKRRRVSPLRATDTGCDMDVFDHIQPDGSDRSRFVMCRPLYISTKVPNNVFMEGKNHQEADIPKALNQWDRVAHIIEAFGVDVKELPPAKGCQDQCFVANIGLNIGKTIVLANYKAAGRSCELGYNCIQPPFHFEGEADCKKWKDGIYIGGYGLFSDNRAFDWIEQQCGVEIIRVQEINPKTYHLDCDLLVVDEKNFLVVESGLSKDSVKQLKQCGNVIFTPNGIETTGITNGVLIPEKRIYLSGALNPEQKDYQKAMEWLLKTMDDLNYTVVFVEMNAFEPSGADLSCTVMHLEG
jgi:N-dimethylarginine dimethylaminohydrolase